jgi:cephalosporin hydroxylase
MKLPLRSPAFIVAVVIAILGTANICQYLMYSAEATKLSNERAMLVRDRDELRMNARISGALPEEIATRQKEEEGKGALSGEAKAKVIRDFHRMIYPLTISTYWLGIQTLQNPMDMWMQQEIITEVRPDFVVECGTYRGGSALIWSMILDQVNPAGRVITIDIDDQTYEARKWPAWKRVDFLKGSSTDAGIVKEVTERVRGKQVMVILDSDHSRDHVLAELRAYAPLVSLNSYVIVQDTDINEVVRLDHGPGPMEALKAFLADNDQFVSDRGRERLLFTNHARGYLKRVK